jgi:hypothetical protein
MSRVLLTVLLAMPWPVFAQAASPPESEMALFVKTKTEELLRVEGREPKKCPEPVEGEDIVVCGVVDDGADQLVFGDQKTEGSGASANSSAATCIPGTGCNPPMAGGVKIGFGNVPPPAIPLEEVYRGLPEPDMIVPEGAPPDYVGPTIEPE